MNKQRVCLECGERIQGRMDKRFCTDHCRSNHYNKQHRNSLEVCSRINYCLRKNHKILSKLVRKSPVVVHRETLLAQGFDFGYITQLRAGEAGHEYRMLYDFSYRNLGGEEYELQHWVEEMPVY
jgi:hypothetical protein